MQTDDISHMAQELCTLFDEKLSLRRGTLQTRLNRAGRRLPARIRAQAQLVAEAETLADHPKLALRIDHVRVARAHAEVRAHLRSIDPADRRRGAILGLLGGLAFNLLLLAGLTLAFLRWRGFV
ncbi:MAG: hypothetical protein P8N68_08185 [Paracoccaceae bacterium]|nr:hypothetical protein [Paracoccaceae bacterium]